MPSGTEQCACFTCKQITSRLSDTPIWSFCSGRVLRSTSIKRITASSFHANTVMDGIPCSACYPSTNAPSSYILPTLQQRSNKRNRDVTEMFPMSFQHEPLNRFQSLETFVANYLYNYKNI